MKRCRRTFWMAIASCVFCLIAGFICFFVPTLAANASATTETLLETSDLLKTGLENVSTEYTYTSDETDYKGIRFQGNGVHMFNGAFKDSATIEYGIMSQWTGVAFGVCDTDGNELITFVRNQANLWVLSAYAYYNGTYSYIKDDNTVTTTTEKWEKHTDLPLDTRTSYVLPQSGKGTGTVSFNLTNGNFRITVTNTQGGTYTVADYALDEDDATKLADGFIVTVRGLDGAKPSDVAPANPGINVLITKINGISIGEQTVSATFVNHDIWYDGELFINGENVIKLPYGSALKDFCYFEKCAIGSLTQLTKLTGMISCTEDFSEKEAGDYTITVGEDDTSKRYKIIVLPSEKIDDLIVLESGLLKEKYTYKDYTGIHFEGDISSAKIVGVFKGSATLEYALTEKWRGVAFGICDLDGNEIATVVRNQRNLYFTSGYAYYNGTYSWIKDAVSSNTTTEKWDSYLNLPQADAQTPQAEGGVGTLTFTVSGTSLSITTSSSSSLIYPMANFTLTDFDAEVLSKGFAICIRALDDERNSDVAPANAGLKVLLTKINGVAMNSDRISYSYQFNEASYPGFSDGNTIYLAENNSLLALEAEANKKYAENWVNTQATMLELRWNGEYDVSQANSYEIEAYHENSDDVFTYTLIVEDSHEIILDVNGGVPMDPIYYSNHTWDFEIPTPERAYWTFGGWYLEEEPFAGMTATMNEDIILKAKWIDDTPPIMYFNDIEAVIRIAGVNSLPIAKTDVTATDGVQGDLSVDSISIFIKEPNTSEFVEYDAFEFDTTAYGFYIIKYVATDGGGNQVFLERSIYYTPAIPTLTLDGEIELEYYVGQKIYLPTASAISGDSQLPITLSVMFGNEKLNVVNNAFVPSEVGEYVILYLAEDDYEQIASRSLVINIVEDDLAPVIQVNFTLEQILLGEKIELPTASVTDNVEQELSVSVEVFKGTQLVSQGSFTPTETGVYTIMYVCMDEAGNEGRVEYQVTVYENIEDAPNKANYEFLIWGSVIGVCVVAVVVIILLRVSKKNKRKEN